MPPSLSPLMSHHVAVIGAGAGGLVAARELRREGHTAVVFERQNQAGGTWVYTPQTEPDPLSLDPTRHIIHSSLYSSLRTNLPRESMGFRDVPFLARPKSKDRRRFPGHVEVLDYLSEFAREFGVEEMVRFGTEVVQVGLVGDGKWRVRCKDEGCKGVDGGDEIFDAVVVCNGHYMEPRLADVPGIGSWPGNQMHCHNYRVPEPFRDQVIVLIGNSASADDISREIAGVAKEVHIASRSHAPETYVKQPGHDNLWLHSMIERTHEDGSVVFQNGRKVFADAIMHCTGYKYHFPFLETNGIVTVDDNRVGPLYKDVFPPTLAPGLSFVGIPWQVIPFPIFELQSKWIAGVLSGRIMIPSQEEMMEEVKSFYSTIEARGLPKRYTHRMGEAQFEYYNWLAEQCGCPEVEEWRKEMYFSATIRKRDHPETYRDEWDDHHLVVQAYDDFSRYTSNKANSKCIS